MFKALSMPVFRLVPFALMLGCSLTITSVAQAADPAATEVAPSSAVKGKKPKSGDPNEIVCRSEEVLGSRLAKQKRCMTRSEWAEARRTNRADVERAQVQRGSVTQ